MVRCGPVGVKDSYPETSNPQERFRETPVDLCFQAITELSLPSRMNVPDTHERCKRSSRWLTRRGRRSIGGMVRGPALCARTSRFLENGCAARGYPHYAG